MEKHKKARARLPANEGIFAVKSCEARAVQMAPPFHFIMPAKIECKLQCSSCCHAHAGGKKYCAEIGYVTFDCRRAARGMPPICAVHLSDFFSSSHVLCFFLCNSLATNACVTSRIRHCVLIYFAARTSGCKLFLSLQMALDRCQIAADRARPDAFWMLCYTLDTPDKRVAYPLTKPHANIHTIVNIQHRP